MQTRQELNGKLPAISSLEDRKSFNFALARCPQLYLSNVIAFSHLWVCSTPKLAREIRKTHNWHTNKWHLEYDKITWIKAISTGVEIAMLAKQTSAPTIVGHNGFLNWTFIVQP